MYFEQTDYQIRCEWGEGGIARLGSSSDVVIVVDTLSFSTCVDIAVGRGAIVYPYRWADETALEFAKQVGATVARPRRSSAAYTLSPTSLLSIWPGTRLVLPSPNGSALSLSTGDKPTLAGCLRNAQAVAAAAQQLGESVLVVPAGERWADGTLRPSFEDIIAAGAIISEMQSTKSPEALLAQAAFTSLTNDLPALMRSCSSGKELVERGFAEDIELAAQLNVSHSVPLLVDRAYRKYPK